MDWQAENKRVEESNLKCLQRVDCNAMSAVLVAPCTDDTVGISKLFALSDANVVTPHVHDGPSSGWRDKGKAR